MILDLIGVALVGMISAFFYGKRKGKHDERRKMDQEYIETRKRMDAVVIDDDLHALRERMHERGKSGGV